MYKINEQVLGPADPGAPFTTNGAMTFNRLATQMVFIHEVCGDHPIITSLINL